MSDLTSACEAGDNDSKALLEDLAPRLVAFLKKHKEWNNPEVSISVVKNVPLILNNNDWSEVDTLGDNVFDELISSNIESSASLEAEYDIEANDEEMCDQSSAPIVQGSVDIETTQAITNLLSDVTMDALSSCSTKPGEIKSLIQHLQPYRELPSKDRRRRFMAGSIFGDEQVSQDHDVKLFQFWAINPTKTILQNARTFLVGQIIFTLHLGSNKNLEVIFEVYRYNPDNNLYAVEGRTAILKAYKHLLTNISDDISLQKDNDISNSFLFDHSKISSLSEYVPYHEDMNIEERLSLSDNSNSDHDDDSDHDGSENDLYLVDQVINKRFHKQRNQYEFLVKWVGYTDETWELPNNIPFEKINEYETKMETNSKRADTPYQLRPARKQTKKSDYIKSI